MKVLGRRVLVEQVMLKKKSKIITSVAGKENTNENMINHVIVPFDNIIGLDNIE